MISINRNNIVRDIQSMDAVNFVNIYNIYFNNQSFIDFIANDMPLSLIFSDFDLFINQFFPDSSDAVRAVSISCSDFKYDDDFFCVNAMGFPISFNEHISVNFDWDVIEKDILENEDEYNEILKLV